MRFKKTNGMRRNGGHLPWKQRLSRLVESKSSQAFSLLREQLKIPSAEELHQLKIRLDKLERRSSAKAN